MHIRWRLALPAAALVLGSARASAQPPAKPSGGERRVHFQAETVELSEKDDHLLLHGSVVIEVGRYRLTSDRVRVARTPRGVMVDGAGRLSFCPCPGAPVTVGFRSALVAPPTDVLLEQPTVRIGDVPIAWLPYLWLRSPERVGVLPPKLAWRATDGPLAGSGVHVPLPAASYLDFGIAGYLRGGIEVDGRLQTPSSTSRVRFDHLEQSLLSTDLRGSTSADDGFVAWDVDAIRGGRALSGPITLEEAARRYDRGRLLVAYAPDPITAGVGLAVDADRGGAVDGDYPLGPALHMALSPPIGESGTADIAARISTTTAPDSESRTMLEETGSVRFAARPAPLGVDVALETRGIVAVEEALVTRAGAAGVQASIDMPLRRRFGAPTRPWSHIVEPVVQGGLVLADRARAFPMPWLFADRLNTNAAAGARTTFGSAWERIGLSFVVLAGVVGPPDGLDASAWARGTVATPSFGASVDAHAVGPNAAELVSRLRVGRVDSMNLMVRGAGRTAASPLAARLLRQGGWREAPVGYFDREAWTVGGSLTVPWLRWLATSGDIDCDATHRELLSVRASAAYRHPCGCLAIVGWGGHRVGREGVDIGGAIDLIP